VSGRSRTCDAWPTTSVDPKIGQAAGFGGVILHGLCTFGFVARSIVTAVGNNDPNSLVYYGVRFTSPVKPGDSIQTSIWEVGPGPNGTVELAFETKNLNTGKVCTPIPSPCTEFVLMTVLFRPFWVPESPTSRNSGAQSSRYLTWSACTLHIHVSFAIRCASQYHYNNNA